MIIYPGLSLPTGSSDLPEADGPPYASLRSCFGWGLHMPLPLPGRAVVSYTAPSTLTDLMSAVHFCCTVLGVTSTGCYPAPCPVKPGLSSSGAFRPASRDHLSYLSLFNCKILSYYRLSVNPFFTSNGYSQSIPAALLTEPSFATCKMIIFLLQIKAAAPDKFPDQGIVRNVIPRNRQKIIGDPAAASPPHTPALPD